MASSKRKRPSVGGSKPAVNGDKLPPPKRRVSTRKLSTAAAVNPDVNGDVIDAPNATRASPDGDINGYIAPGLVEGANGARSESPLSDAPALLKAPIRNGEVGKSKAAKRLEESENIVSAVVDDAVTNANAVKNGRGKPKAKQENGVKVPGKAPASLTEKKGKTNATDEVGDPEAEDLEEAGEEEVKEALSRPPPVHSDYLPLPWKGRLGYACLNTYLRNSNPPVFSSRTCRIQSILEHRHPLYDPTQPEHPTKNRPDKTKSADIEHGKRYVEALCLANVKDIAKMIAWNDRYNIKFLRLSSEMFPFASHSEYGYKLAPFAAEALAEAGKVIADFGHRVTTHPGQFTQLGSPRKSVIDNAIRDLEYHDEMLTLLNLPEQQNKDAVMVLHMGGVFEGREATLQRFRENYSKLSQSIKNRLVLENDDVSWSVHNLLPICEELNIPCVLDFHHHNIVFDASQIREGTNDIIDLFPRIKVTWDRKGIKQKMHYSEPTPAAITPRQRRKHNARVATLPPCPPDTDLMIEAKDKEQAVFELMRTFKLPGYDRFNDIIPYTRNDDNKTALAAMNKKSRKSKKSAAEADADESELQLFPDDEVGMGGPDGRVYWPPSMEEWLRPKKREVKKKEPAEKSASRVKREAEEIDALGDGEDIESDEQATPATKKAKAAMRRKAAKTAATKGRPKTELPIHVPMPSSDGESEDMDLRDDGGNGDDEPLTPGKRRRGMTAEVQRANGRKGKKRISYKEDDDHDIAMDEA